MSYIQLAEISIIIPVKNNTKGIHQLLYSIFSTQKPDQFPKEIIIVDNLSEPALTIDNQFLNRGISIRVLKCDKKGPAAARNMGAEDAKGEWFLFTDSDCVFTETTLTGYLNANESGIGFAGNVIPLKQNFISNYYNSIRLLNPTHASNSNTHPAYIITANCLIEKKAFDKVDGFNEDFKLASGEDVDLGFRLSKVGTLFFAAQSVVKHDFENSIFDFYQRFYRYGKTIIQLEKIHHISINIESLLPKPKSFVEFLFGCLIKIAIKKGKKYAC